MPSVRVLATDPEAPRHLFAYGTLTPDGPAAEAAGGWSADAVRARLFDLGTSPTLVDVGDPSCDWVEGFVRAVVESELRDRLDPYEGVAEGLYRRSVAVTRSGRVVWVYVYDRPLPPDARGPLVRWDGVRGLLPPEVTRERRIDGHLDRTGEGPGP